MMPKVILTYERRNEGPLRSCSRLDGGARKQRPRSHLGAHCFRKEDTGEEVSRGLAMVRSQQSARTLDGDDLTRVALMLRLDDPGAR
jgi:hypothetical protein